ncbi:MAG: hypothetical protein ACLFTT_16810 [Candidatus Hydrogenedentota bacterium]
MNLQRQTGHFVTGRVRFVLAVVLFWVTVFIIAAEVVTRIQGFAPFQDYNPFVGQEGERIVRDDPYLGYTHRPGRMVVAGKVMTHLDNTLRITQPLEAYARAADRPEVWLFGCSITHGYGLNDDETFAWQLQKKLPEFEIVNFGVEGYSTVQSLLQLERALKERGRPEAATLIYGKFHDERSILSRNWWKDNMKLWDYVASSQPCARLDDEGRLMLDYVKDPYRLFPLARVLAFVNALDEIYTGWHDSNMSQAAVGRALVLEFAQTCKEAGVPFLLAAWDLPGSLTPLVDLCAKNDIPSACVAVPSTPEYIDPATGHPNADAARAIAAHLNTALEPLLRRSPEEAPR